jgi:hypothetical protein
VADKVFDAIGARRFWVLPHAGEYAEHVRSRFDNAVEGRNPEPFVFQ